MTGQLPAPPAHDYALGHDPGELDRLIGQAAFLDGLTEHVARLGRDRTRHAGPRHRLRRRRRLVPPRPPGRARRLGDRRRQRRHRRRHCPRQGAGSGAGQRRVRSRRHHRPLPRRTGGRPRRTADPDVPPRPRRHPRPPAARRASRRRGRLPRAPRRRRHLAPAVPDLRPGGGSNRADPDAARERSRHRTRPVAHLPPPPGSPHPASCRWHGSNRRRPPPPAPRSCRSPAPC